MEAAIALYGDGNLEGARAAFAALAARFADDARARRYLRWVETALEEERAARRLNADAVRAVSDALAPWTEPADAWAVPEVELKVAAAPVVDPPPVLVVDAPPVLVEAAPLPPEETHVDAHAGGQWRADPVPTDEPVRPLSPIAEVPELPPPPRRAGTPPMGTMLGMPPLAQLTPLGPVGGPVGEEPASLAADWYATPTASNLPPLDVPELDEEQIAAIAALNQESGTDPGLVGLHGQARFGTQPGATPSAMHGFGTQPGTAPTSPLLHGAGRGTPGGTIDGVAPPSEFDFLETNPRQSAQPAPPPPAHASPFAPAADALPIPPPVERRPGSLGNVPVDGLAAITSVLGGPRADDTPTYAQKPFTRTSTNLGAAWPADTVARLFAESESALEHGDRVAALSFAEEALSQAGGLSSEGAIAHLPALERIYRGLIGNQAARLRVAEARPADAALDPRAAFLLSRLDGVLSVEDLLDVSGMALLPAMRLLAQLIVNGAVIVGP